MGKREGSMTPQQIANKRQYDKLRRRRIAEGDPSPPHLKRLVSQKFRDQARERALINNPARNQVVFDAKMTETMLLGKAQSRKIDYLAAEIGVSECRLYKELARWGLSRSRL